MLPSGMRVGVKGESQRSAVSVPSEPILPFKRLKDKVAVVGFAGTTRHMAPYDDPDWEIWGLNEAHRQNFMKRITRWFQIHQTWDFTKQMGEAFVEHWDWLQQDHNFPIYMQDKYDEVPASAKYPLDEITDTFLSNVLRGGEVNRYFTSSFAYMAALIALLGYKEFAVYGFEMSTETEFSYQKGSTEFWLGLLAGLGVKIHISPQCRLLAGRLYGYEVSRMINRQRLEFLLRVGDVKAKLALGKVHQLHGSRIMLEDLIRESDTDEEKEAYKSRHDEMFVRELAALSVVNEQDGENRGYRGLIETVDNMHSGKDPGDGFDGISIGDQDDEYEATIQATAEAEAAKTKPAVSLASN